jgi:hypothetical protein
MFDIRQPLGSDGGYDEVRHAYTKGLREAFAESPEGKALIEKQGDTCWAECMLRFFFSHIGGHPAEMPVRDHDEAVFELIPRKVSTKADAAPEIIQELRAFWSFIDREYQLPNARRILETLGDDAVVRLKGALADVRNWGMAKAVVMSGTEAGYDMTTREGIETWMIEYNLRLSQQHVEPVDGIDDFDDDELDDSYESVQALYSLNPFRFPRSETNPAPRPSVPPGYRRQKRKDRKTQRQARKRNRH